MTLTALINKLHSADGEELYDAFHRIGAENIERLLGLKILIQTAHFKLTKGDKYGN